MRNRASHAVKGALDDWRAPDDAVFIIHNGMQEQEPAF